MLNGVVETRDQATQTYKNHRAQTDWKYAEFLELVVAKEVEMGDHILTREIISSRGKTWKPDFLENFFQVPLITIKVWSSDGGGKWDWHYYVKIINNNVGKKIRIYCEEASEPKRVFTTSRYDRDIACCFHIEALEEGIREEWETHIVIQPYSYHN